MLLFNGIFSVSLKTRLTLEPVSEGEPIDWSSAVLSASSAFIYFQKHHSAQPFNKLQWRVCV